MFFPSEEHVDEYTQEYSIQELEEILLELKALRFDSQKDLDRFMSPDYDPETDYENEEEKRIAVEFDIQ